MWRSRITVPAHLLQANPFLPEGDGQPNNSGGPGGQQGGNGDQNQGQQGGQTGGTGPGSLQGQQGGANQGQGGQTGGTGDAQRLEDLPPWVQKIVKDARAEAASARTSAKATAAQEARDAVLQDLGKALGFVKDEPVDPAKLTADLKERDSRLREATVQLAVLRAAAKAGGDPDALLDSRSFLDSLQSLDPSAEGFAGQVSAAIEKAVKDNPRLGTGAPGGASGGQIDGGSREPDLSGELSWDQADTLAKKSRMRFGGGRS